MTALQLIVLALAVTRLSLMFVKEDGPMYIFKKLRDKVGIQNISLPNGDIKTFVIDEEHNLFGGLLACVWCTSIWVSAILTILYYLLPTVAIFISMILALSMISILINVYIEKMSNENKTND